MEEHIRYISYILFKYYPDTYLEQIYSVITEGLQLGFTEEHFELNEDIQIPYKYLSVPLLEFILSLILQSKMKRVVRENGHIVFQRYSQSHVLNSDIHRTCIQLFTHAFEYKKPNEVVFFLRKKYIQEKEKRSKNIISNIFYHNKRILTSSSTSCT